MTVSPETPVAHVDELHAESGKVVQYKGEDVALFRIGDDVFAVENTCPHQGASLAEGWIEDETISCPWHAWCFELRTGRMTMGDYATINVYETRIDGGKVFITGLKHRAT